jgi:dihydroxy-acid dehydratase
MDAKLNPKTKLPSRRAATIPEPTFLGPPRALGIMRGAVAAETIANISDLQPAGRYVAKDTVEGGGVPLLIGILLDHGYPHGECSTVRGGAVADRLKRVVWNKDQSVVRPADKPLSATSGVVGLKGSRALTGATGRVAGMAGLQFIGPARCFDGEEARFGAVKNKNYREGQVLVIRYEGPRGGPGMREGVSTTAASCAGREARPAHFGAITRFGRTVERICYADL